jgi:putative N6-adenine-specific DNA methylase
MSYKTATSSNSCTTKPSLFITCASGLEPLLEKELASLGLRDVRSGFRGVYAPNTLENIYKINYLSRLATRVLLPLAEFFCPDTETLYREAKKIPWLDYLDETKTLAIDANIHHPHIRHSLYGAQLVKDAICDLIREKRGARPSVNVKSPDIQLSVFIQNHKATIGLDTSGAPLYKRGWKETSGEAGLPETLAAAILMRTGYSEEETLCDPFCGAGTFLIEAAMMASRTPAGFFRKSWGFFHLPTFDAAAWKAFRHHWDEQRVPLETQRIIGSDSDAESIRISRDHVRKTGFEKGIFLSRTPVSKFIPPISPTLVITDPPFGKRLQTSPELYQDFGHFLKTKCPTPPSSYLLTSSFPLAKATGCSVLSEWPVSHGGLNITLYQLKT